MSDNPVQEVISDLLEHLEALETRCAALTQLVKEKGVGTEEEFARCAKQASEASGIKWRAARVRMEHLFASVHEPSDKASGARAGNPETQPQDQSKKDSEQTVAKEREKAKTPGSPDKGHGAQPQQGQASERDSEGSGEKHWPSQPSEEGKSRPSEKPSRETHVEEKKATKTESFEKFEKKDESDGDKGADNAA